MSAPYNIDLQISVSSGHGSASFGGPIPKTSLMGTIRAVVVVVPSPGPAPSYEWTLQNLDGNTILGSVGTLNGDTTSLEEMPLVEGGSFTILNATADGVYMVQLVVDAAGLP